MVTLTGRTQRYAESWTVIIYSIVVLTILFFYFQQCRTDVIYGDDLYMYNDLQQRHGFWQTVNLPVVSQKYRPIHGLNLYFLEHFINRKVAGYYWFNIALQAANCVILALIINLILRSFILSGLFALVGGLSRFAVFNISQLLVGGALEGMALLFFLLSFYFVARSYAKDNDNTGSNAYHSLGMALLFANLSFYTHERYLVMVVFIALIGIFFPFNKKITTRKKFLLVCFCAGSLLLNVFLKKSIFGMPVFVGTSGTSMTFSLPTVITFFFQGVASIFEINRGPGHLTGITFADLPALWRFFSILLCACFLFILVAFVRSFFLRRAATNADEPRSNDGLFFIACGGLFFLLLIPAVMTIRLEQRWLQGSFAVFLVMIAVAISRIKVGSIKTRSVLFLAFIALFLSVDINYLKRGYRYTYLQNAENIALAFKKSIDLNTIHPATKKLVILDLEKGANAANTFNWVLGQGLFFDFYQNASKEIIYTDSVYDRLAANAPGKLEFDPVNEQLLIVRKNVIDLSRVFLTDSLHDIANKLDRLDNGKPPVTYNTAKLEIEQGKLDGFESTGFYSSEGPFQWTNGDATIRLLGDFVVTMASTVRLSTTMPPACSGVTPVVSLVDANHNETQPSKTSREGDVFVYEFKLPKPTLLMAIRLRGQLIDAGADIRNLSFPFLKLELVNQ